MGMSSRHIHIHGHESLTPIKNTQQNSTDYQSPLPVTDNGFPILAIAVVGIMATAILLVGYYIFITKCCMNWRQVDPLRRFSITRARQNEDTLISYSPASLQSRGLDEFLIREIPTFQFGRIDGEDQMGLSKCVVCLVEFQEQDTLRVLPKCSHAFHLDCIDIWLQSNANCPLCRTSISGANTKYPINQIVAPNSSPQDPHPFIRNLMSSDEDFVVIELSGEDGTLVLSQSNRETDGGHSETKFEPKIGKFKTGKFHHHSSIMGDECINVREKDDQFSVQPIRRSFSMDSATDRHVYLSVQEIIRQNNLAIEVRNSEECSNRVQRSFFSFGNGRVGSRSAVLPIEF